MAETGQSGEPTGAETPISVLALGAWSRHGRGAELWWDLVSLNPDELSDFSIHSCPYGFNFDEQAVPPYELPELLEMADGEKVETPQQWTARRAELLHLFTDQMFGAAPPPPDKVRFRVLEQDANALGGLAHRKQVRIDFSADPDGPGMELLLYTPAGNDAPVATFLGLNFRGNHGVHDDPAIRRPSGWVLPTPDRNVEARGQSAPRWQLENVLLRGYGLATACYGDIDPDFDDGFKNGIHRLFPPRTPSDWGSIASWAWGLSRALDYLELDAAVDASRVAVMGHSRLGKTALWAGVTDERFALVIPINSGGCGAALSRHISGETVEICNVRFPHWFCGNYKAYNGRENEMPFDQHMLLALVAPRPVYVASGEDDVWADPHGEFLATREAGPAYELLGKRGLRVTERPPVDEPVMHDVGYHVRTGGHAVTEYDWRCFLDFADMHLSVE